MSIPRSSSRETTQPTNVSNLPTAPPAPIPPVKPKTAAQLKKEARDEELIAETERDLLAKVMENTMLGEGHNVDVNAIGPRHTTLRPKWARI
jgi:hypothetical protein